MEEGNNLIIRTFRNMIIVIIIIFIIGALFFAFGINNFLIHRELENIVTPFTFAIVFLGLGMLFIIILKHPVPTKQDVLDGKAIYQETQIITGNDTIKTYNILWK